MGQVLLRASDQGDTYMVWRDLATPPARADYTVVRAQTLGFAIQSIDRALASQLPGETTDDALTRSLKHGPFSNPFGERSLSQHLANALLPDRLVRTIIEASQSPNPLLRIIPSPRLARVPWELLPLPDGRRLLEVIPIRLDVPAVLNADRGNIPRTWAANASAPALYIIDPTVGAGPELAPLVDRKHGSPALRTLRLHIQTRIAAGRAEEEDVELGVFGSPNRAWLGQRLRSLKPSRLVYFGHATSNADEPGSAALHLADGMQRYGLARSVNNAHRPFTALDLLLGTLRRPPDTDLLYPIDGKVVGHEIWPMPPRVALIGCTSGADHLAAETFGLVMAILNAGAELVSATRWTLPVEEAFRRVYGEAMGTRLPAVELALAIDEAHEAEDAVLALRDWQLDRLRAWEQHAHPADSPIAWASVTTHVATGSPRVDE